MTEISEQYSGMIGIIDDRHHEIFERIGIESGNMHEHLGCRTILGKNRDKPPPEFRTGLYGPWFIF